MKIQIDTNKKVISVEEDVNLDEFFKALKRLFPNGGWKEYALKTETIINWFNPIIYERELSPHTPYPWWPYNPIITCDTVSGASQGITRTDGIYCIEA